MHLLASIFAHAGALHLISNLLGLAIVGPRVWRALGKWRFAALFLISGALANASAAALLDRPVTGASGAVAGVMAAHLVLFPSARIAPFIGLWLALQVVFATLGLDFAGVAWPAHIVGFLLGLLIARSPAMARGSNMPLFKRRGIQGGR